MSWETLDCGTCGMSWQRTLVGGTKPANCPDCHRAAKTLRNRARTESADPSPRLAANVTRYRLGIELARHGFRCGRQKEVVQILDAIIDADVTETMLTETIWAAAQRATLTRLVDAGVDLTPAAAYLEQVSA